MEVKIGYLQDIFRDNVDNRRRQEVKDSRAVQEDRTAPANLPTRSFQKQYNSHEFDERLGGTFLNPKQGWEYK